MRRACRFAAACAALVLAAPASIAQPFMMWSGVPDANPPTVSTLGVPCIQDFSAPTAAAMPSI
jgi:hypothetical protein